MSQAESLVTKLLQSPIVKEFLLFQLREKIAILQDMITEKQREANRVVTPSIQVLKRTIS